MNIQTISQRIISLDSKIDNLEVKIEEAEVKGEKEKALNLQLEKNALIGERTQWVALLAKQQQQGMVIFFVL